LKHGREGCADGDADGGANWIGVGAGRRPGGLGLGGCGARVFEGQARDARTCCASDGGEAGLGGCAGTGGLGRWELSGFPEREHAFQPREDALEAGVDQQVQGCQQRALHGEAISLGMKTGAHVGEVQCQGGLN